MQEFVTYQVTNAIVLVTLILSQDDQVCQYSYTADQQHGDDTSNDLIASTTVDIICQSGKSFSFEYAVNLIINKYLQLEVSMEV